MKIFLVIPDNTKSVMVIYPTDKLDIYGRPQITGHDYEKDQLQSMIVNEEPCEYCSGMPSKYKCFGFAEYFEREKADDNTELSIEVKFCPNCGLKLGKDVEKC